VKERVVEYVVLALMDVVLLIAVLLHIKPYFTNTQLNFLVIPIASTIFCLLNAFLVFGYGMGIAFFVISVVISWIVEQLGVSTGLIFGRYEYTDVLGPKLGDVPWIIPAYWFMLIYVGFMITNLITEDQPSGRTSESAVHIGWLALLGAFVTTAYDLGFDPYMSSPAIRAWIWKDGGDYFGVPTQNFLGWIGTVFVISIILRWLFQVIPIRPVGRPTKIIATLPILLYVSFWFGHAGHTYAPPTRVISLVALGIPAVTAIASWRRWKVPIGYPFERAPASGKRMPIDREER